MRWIHKTDSRRRGWHGSGFTLIELLVVLSILGLIAAFAGPRLFKSLGGAKTDAAKIQIENIAAGIDLYKLETGQYPPTLLALIEAPAGAERWNGPYLRKKTIPKDPWGRDFIYQFPGENGPFDLSSLGADGMPGGTGEDADVVGWE